jgi:hypothetical protein
MSDKREVSILVTVDDVHYDFHKVARALEQAGLHQVDLMPFSGIVGGVVDPDCLDTLKAVCGVESVEFQSQTHSM